MISSAYEFGHQLNMSGKVKNQIRIAKAHYTCGYLGKYACWRRGKWIEEEEAYTKKLMSAFQSGLLDLSNGTTLRSFLSEKLNW